MNMKCLIEIISIALHFGSTNRTRQQEDHEVIEGGCSVNNSFRQLAFL
jgi:hypothetical protein